MDSYFDLITRFSSLLLKGSLMTVEVLLVAAALSFALGAFWGVFLCDRLRLSFFSSLIEGIAFILRAIPFYIHLLIIYFVLPDLLGCSLNPFLASVIALGFSSSGYVAQIVRGAMNAIPERQWEAAHLLGYSPFQTLRHIIFPQMLRHALPMLTGELDAILKSTAIVSSIGILDLTRVGMNIVSREMEPVPIYLTIASFYICLSLAINLTTKAIERRFSYVKN